MLLHVEYNVLLVTPLVVDQQLIAYLEILEELDSGTQYFFGDVLQYWTGFHGVRVVFVVCHILVPVLIHNQFTQSGLD